MPGARAGKRSLPKKLWMAVGASRRTQPANLFGQVASLASSLAISPDKGIARLVHFVPLVNDDDLRAIWFYRLVNWAVEKGSPELPVLNGAKDDILTLKKRIKIGQGETPTLRCQGETRFLPELIQLNLVFLSHLLKKRNQCLLDRAHGGIIFDEICARATARTSQNS